MSDDNFIGRWSRLKRETEREKRRAEPPSQRPSEARTGPPAPATAPPSAAPGETRSSAAQPFDPATLPPLDSIVAGTDIRAFLQKGVPAELTKAALRRVWVADPAIRDFMEVAENQWDFTDPAAIPGFGTLEGDDKIRQLVSQAVGEPLEAPPVGPAGEEPVGPAGEEETRPVDRQADSTDADAARAPPERENADDQSTAVPAASQHPESASDRGPAPKRKGHGAAMPH